jgi:hypothetical protein
MMNPDRHGNAILQTFILFRKKEKNRLTVPARLVLREKFKGRK